MSAQRHNLLMWGLTLSAIGLLLGICGIVTALLRTP